MAFNALPKTNEISPDATVTFPVDQVKGLLSGDTMYADTTSKYIEQVGANQTVTSVSPMVKLSDQPYVYKIGSTYILLGYNTSQIYYSTDFITWTQSTDPKLVDPSNPNSSGGYLNFRPCVDESTNTLYLIVYFMYQYGSSGVQGNAIFKTTDGITWDHVVLPGSLGYSTLLARGNHIMVPVYDYDEMDLNKQQHIRESFDGGATWTIRYYTSYIYLSHTQTYFTYINGLYILIGTDMMGSMWISTDAITWTLRAHDGIGSLNIESNDFLVDNGYLYWVRGMILVRMKLSTTAPLTQPVEIVGYVNTGMYGDRGTLIKIGSNIGYLPKREKSVKKYEVSSAPMSWTNLFTASGNGYLAVTTGSTNVTLNVVSLLSTLYQN